MSAGGTQGESKACAGSMRTQDTSGHGPRGTLYAAAGARRFYFLEARSVSRESRWYRPRVSAEEREREVHRGLCRSPSPGGRVAFNGIICLTCSYVCEGVRPFLFFSFLLFSSVLWIGFFNGETLHDLQ